MATIQFKILESTRSAAQSVKAHRFRSFLTTLGIIIGVASVISVVSVLQGFSMYISSQFDGIGANVINIERYTPPKSRLQGKWSRLTYQDYLKIKHNIPGVSYVTPSVQVWGSQGGVTYRDQSVPTQVFGSASSYQSLNAVNCEYGRFINQSDDDSRRRVAVIGSSLISSLEIQGDPVGQHVQILGEWFKIICVAETRGELFGFDQDDFVLMPFTTAKSILGDRSWRTNVTISMSVDDVNQLTQVKRQITNVLRRSHSIKDGDPNDFKISSADQMLETFGSIIGGTTLVLGGIVSISLLVGGIGIMNIMLVSVTERTREIGIQKALGATKFDILLQFLIEAIFLCLLGGLVGLILGFAGGSIISSVANLPPASVPIWAVALSFGFSALIGLIFGIIPAAKASNLDPIDALRYE